jgi:hypothetical protein
MPKTGKSTPRTTVAADTTTTAGLGVLARGGAGPAGQPAADGGTAFPPHQQSGDHAGQHAQAGDRRRDSSQQPELVAHVSLDSAPSWAAVALVIV